MIELDGIELQRVVAIRCDVDTAFNTHIDFYFDSKLAECQDVLPLMKYDLTQVAKQTGDDLGDGLVQGMRHILNLIDNMEP